MSWKINAGDIIPLRHHRSITSDTVEEKDDYNSDLCVYQETTVNRTFVHKNNISLTNANLNELQMLKELNHDNVNSFVGACVDEQPFCMLYAHCSKGTLQDILETAEIKMDWTFKSSIINDIVKGMLYISNSRLKTHGNLKTSTCFLNSNLVLQIGKIGLNSLSDEERCPPRSDYEKYREMMWTAPEVLFRNNPRGTAEGDVYSFGIILHDIMTRDTPYTIDTSRPQDIINRVYTAETPPFRPAVPNTFQAENVMHIYELMQQCWQQSSHNRPKFEQIRNTLVTINEGRQVNTIDNRMLLMEKFAGNLQEIVDARTEDLVIEKKRTDELLYRMIPPMIVEKLKAGQTIKSELFDNVTVCFSDIVDFMQISASRIPSEVVDILNELYSLFDEITKQHDVYHTESVGDACMVVSGLPERNGHRHAAEIANMALHLLDAVRHRREAVLRLRIVVHTGPCAAGVVGVTMPRYFLFGEAVNTASRMVSSGEALKIHVSQSAYDALSTFPQYIMTLRGEIEDNVKGTQKTYCLEGVRPIDG